MYHIFFIQSSVSGHLDCFRWTFRLLPCLGCCKQCYNEHWGTCILLHHVFSRYVPKSGGTPLWYSCLENPIDGGAWKASVSRMYFPDKKVKAEKLSPRQLMKSKSLQSHVLQSCRHCSS